MPMLCALEQLGESVSSGTEAWKDPVCLVNSWREIVGERRWQDLRLELVVVIEHVPRMSKSHSVCAHQSLTTSSPGGKKKKGKKKKDVI